MNKKERAAANTMNEIETKAVAEEINRLHHEILSVARTTLEKAIRIGELLAKQKASLGHGQWLPWLEANVELNPRTAQRYIRVWENRQMLKYDSVSHLTQAYVLLADSSSGAAIPQAQTAGDIDLAPEVELWQLENPELYRKALAVTKPITKGLGSWSESDHANLIFLVFWMISKGVTIETGLRRIMTEVERRIAEEKRAVQLAERLKTLRAACSS
jgi:hypothetical protein